MSASGVLRVTTVSRRTRAAGEFAATGVSDGEIEHIEREDEVSDRPAGGHAPPFEIVFPSCAP